MLSASRSGGCMRRAGSSDQLQRHSAGGRGSAWVLAQPEATLAWHACQPA